MPPVLPHLFSQIKQSKQEQEEESSDQEMEQDPDHKTHQNTLTTMQNQILSSPSDNDLDHATDTHQESEIKSQPANQTQHAHQCANDGQEATATEVTEAAMETSKEAGDDGKGRSERRMEKEEESGRERLKRHRGEVAGQVWIPDIWGQEDSLKDWIDCSGFDAALVPKGIMSARSALIEEGGRASSGRLGVQNSG